MTFPANPAAAVAPTAEQRRRERLAPLVKDALSLLQFAAANGRAVDAAVRDPVLATADAVDRDATTLADEQAFFKAYEALTLAMAPVTAETLAASRTVLPRLDQLRSKEGLLAGLQGLTLGRFVNALSFIVVLVGACLALAYYSLGATTFERFQSLDVELIKQGGQLRQAEMTLKLAEQAVQQLAQQDPKTTADAMASAQKKVMDAGADVDKLKGSSSRLFDEAQDLPNRLWKWSQLTCDRALLAWLMCTSVDRRDFGMEPGWTVKVESARATVARMNDIVLPLLLGWLGAHAWVLRRMTVDIAAKALAKGSMLSTLVRLSLGALAGFSSSWLLPQELVAGAQLKALPAWGLAFVAGYGTELVFAFLDRIIAAFTNKTS